MHQHSENILNTQIEQLSPPAYKFSWFDWFCLWYPPGWLILFNRHWQHYHHDPDGWNWLEYLLFLIPGGFYLALLIRWLRLGCRIPGGEVAEFDINYQQAFRDQIIHPIVKYYFQGKLQQVENLPETESLIVVMNHAGMSFPWDFLTLGYLLSEKTGWVVQPLGGVPLFDSVWMRWWLPSGWSKVLGGVKAQFDDFEAAVKEGRIILYAPEGLRGPMKGWRKRYQLEKFDISFVQLSDRYHVPILPVVCIGSEKLHPWTINMKAFARLLKLPFLPISPLIPLFALFPSMGVWANKSRLRYFIQKLEITEFKEDNFTRTEAYQKAQQLRVKMQKEIYQLLNNS
ncbi:MAG: glycerol acyltransferase [Cyanomargarita calcarea GSE-NOS-MK-12-04C]|uniref:Glycerol acyltransferase n=1 Tax=Cyanomargarita calcarea GSE-NOS-MK-12-04C TaxID=2839659 RepID=A0A951UT65_9CYAN|nr:glycerol acyltransferase [Cyanomargarita calcarea GSE-NOS-MK-12-04C]